MKEFRIAKCLCYAGTEYAEVKECAIFKDDSRKAIIQTDKDGRKYFSVDNWIQSNPEMDSFNYVALDFMKLSFTGKPMKDYIGYLGKILGSTEYDLVWMMFKDIYNEGELFVRKKDIDRKKLLRYFTIRQTVVE